MVICDTQDRASFRQDGAAKHPLATGEHSRVTLWCLEPGQEIKPHTHPGDHAWTVQQGEGWFLDDGGSHPVAPGSFVFAPAGEVHGMRAKTRLVFVSVTAG